MAARRDQRTGTVAYRSQQAWYKASRDLVEYHGGHESAEAALRRVGVTCLRSVERHGRDAWKREVEALLRRYDPEGFSEFQHMRRQTVGLHPQPRPASEIEAERRAAGLPMPTPMTRRLVAVG